MATVEINEEIMADGSVLRLISAEFVIRWLPATGGTMEFDRVSVRRYTEDNGNSLKRGIIRPDIRSSRT